MQGSVNAAPRGGSIGTAIIGGIVGSLVTAAALVYVAPRYYASRIVRQGMLADPQILPDTAEALRDAQYLPVLNANRKAIETPFGSSWKGASKPDVTLVEYFDYACPYCKASNPIVDRLLQEDKGLRVVYRELPILGPDSVAAARLSLAASKAGRFSKFHDTLWATGRPSPQANSIAAQAAAIAAQPPNDPAIEAEIRQNFEVAQRLGATGTPLFVIGNRVMNTAVGYEGLKKSIEIARQRN
jgi:protein-disulfide isomerase